MSQPISVLRKDMASDPVIHTISSVFLFAFSMMLLVKLLIVSNYGFDFTDESFYWTWISKPKLYSATVSKFGSIYHLFFDIFNQNLVLLRQANIILTFLLASFLSYLVLQKSRDPDRPNALFNVLIAMAIASSSLMVFNFGLITPSYNTLNFQGLMITTMGLTVLEKKERNYVISALLIGLGGTITFMAKPSTAMFLAIISVGYLYFCRLLKPRLFILIFAFTILFAVGVAIYIDGSLFAFVLSLKQGLYKAQLLDPSGHGFSKIIRLDDFYWSQESKTILYFHVPFLMLTSLLLLSQNERFKFFGFLFVVIFCIEYLLIQLYSLSWSMIFDPVLGVLFLLVPVLILLPANIYYQKRLVSFSSKKVMLALLFLIMPYIYAIGTNNNYWYMLPHAVLFWVLSGLVFLKPVLNRNNLIAIAFPGILFAQLLTFISIQAFVEKPYRQPQPLFSNDVSMNFPNHSSKLILSRQAEDFITRLKNAAYSAGFSKNIPIIDLTGRTPVAAIILEGESVGVPWLLGSYKGSSDYAVHVLSKVDVEKIQKSWVLTEPEGYAKIPDSVLKPLGLDLQKDYVFVKALKLPELAGNPGQYRTLQLYKPKSTT